MNRSDLYLLKLPPLEHLIDGNESLSSPSETMWRAPNTMDAMEAKSQEALDHESMEARPGRAEPNNLRDQLAVREGLRKWPTPNTRDHHAQGANHNVKAHSSALSTVIQKKWPTPDSSQARTIEMSPECSLDTGESTPPTSLNPEWVSWLMGFPQNWTVTDTHPE
jgi:hypothetical protein